jgi:nitroreductase
MKKTAPTDLPILDVVKNRWSPYAFAETPVPRETLLTILEATRWSASSFNEQPWRFIIGERGQGQAFEKLLETLIPQNAAWAKNAPVLMLGVAKKTFSHNGSPNRVAFYDLGQAVGTLTMQATALGLFLHQMGGFDADKARTLFAIPDDYEIGAVIALGSLGAPESLENDGLRARHNNPERVRKPLTELLFGANFGETF